MGCGKESDLVKHSHMVLEESGGPCGSCSLFYPLFSTDFCLEGGAPSQNYAPAAMQAARPPRETLSSWPEEMEKRILAGQSTGGIPKNKTEGGGSLILYMKPTSLRLTSKLYTNRTNSKQHIKY